MRGALALTLIAGAQVALWASPAAAIAIGYNVTTTADVATNAGACGNTTIVSPPNPAALSLREAACLANNIAGTTTINVPAGTYTLTHGEVAIGTHSGQNVTVTGAGAASTIITAGGLSRVLDYDPGLIGGIKATISGVTITGGADSTFGGAGIIAGSGNTSTADTLTIDSSILTGNHANAATPTITNQPGGAVQFVGGSLTITNSIMSGNSSASSPGSGVAYAATGATGAESLAVTNSTFSGNTATNTNGTSVTNGGALNLRGLPTTTYTVSDSTFTNNQVVATTGGALGAGIRQESGKLILSRSTFTGNAVSGGSVPPAGGAIEVTTGTATLHFNRIVGNSATLGSALHVGSGIGVGLVDASENWYGCNTGPGGTGCDTVSGTATLAPFLQLKAGASPSTVVGPNATSSVTASLTSDSANGAVASSDLTAFAAVPAKFSDPLPIPATIGGGSGVISVLFALGQASATYNSKTSSGAGHVLAALDNASVTVPLTVNLAPGVTTNPSDQTVHSGDVATFIAAASGLPTPTVQWQRSTNGGSTFANIVGATSTSYSFTAATADSGNQYRAVFTSTAGTATTTAATLSVDQPPAFTSGGTATFTTGTAGSFTITTSGVPAITAITETGTLPSGLSFTDNGNGTATLAGTPNAGSGGSYPVALTATNGVSPNGTQSLTVQVNQAPAVTSNPATQTVNPSTSVTFAAAASGVPTPTVQWQRSTNGGASFTDIVGATSTSLTFAAVAADNGNQYRAVFTNVVSTATTTAATLNVGSAPAFTSPSAAPFAVGTAGSFAITTSGVPSATISRTGIFPAWLTLTDNGDGTASLTGTPPVGAGGTYAFTLKAANGFSPSASQPFTLSVHESPTITSTDHATFTVGSAGTFGVTTTGGFPTTTSIIETGALPSGVTLVDSGSGTATLAGTPAGGTAGSYPITVKAAAVGGLTAARTQSFSLTVLGPPAITSANHATFTAGAAGSFTVQTTAGNPVDTTITRTGLLPSGVTFVDNGNGTATLGGTSAAGTHGSYPITITASNGVLPDAGQSFTLTVNEPPRISSVDHVTFAKGVADAFQITTAPGEPSAVTLSAPAADLPPGTTFVDKGDGTATLGGTPTANGVFAFTITASNGVAPNATQSFTATVTSAPTITSTDHVTFTTGAAGSFSVQTTAGTPTATTLSATGTLPSGVTFVDNHDGTATLAGIPAVGTGDSFPITITAANSVTSSTQSFTLTVTELPAITSVDHATFIVGTSDTFTVHTTAGFPATSTLTEAGALPSGLSFADNGDGTATLSGTPDAGTGDSYPLTVTATNSAGHTDQAFTLTVDETPVFTSTDHVKFETGSAGTFTVTTGDGFPVPPALTTSDTLPTGVSLVDNGDGTATLAGTPAAGTGGVYPLTIKATNGATTDGIQDFSLTVDQPPTITSGDQATYSVGVPGTFDVTTAGYPAPSVTYTGALPTGITLSDNGNGTAVVAGTPTVAGDYPITIFAANGVSSPAAQGFTLHVVKVAQTITVTSSPPLPAIVGGSYLLAATSDSNLAVAFTIDAATTNDACSLTGSTVSLDHTGTCVVDFDQAGSGVYLAAPQVQQSFGVNTVATSVAVVSSTSPTVFGQAAHATATISAGGATPAGTVQFAVDGTDLGAPVTVSSGTASSDDLADSGGQPLAPGSHAITATFTPQDPTTYAGSQGPVTQVVNQAATSTAVTVNSGSVTATVSPVAPGAGTPTKSVAFTVGGHNVGSATLSAGVATLAYSVPPGMTQQVGAAYAGDVNFTASSASTSRSDPSITASLTSAHAKTRYGWYRSAVTVTFTCTTHGAPLTGACPAPVHLTHSGAAQSVSRTITATDGGTRTVVVRVNIDLVAPSVRVTGVKNGATYDGKAPAAQCVGKDTLSGLASCKITKSVSGTTTRYKATATDRAGNTRSVSGSYRTLGMSLAGATLVKGAFNVKLGHSYTLIVYSSTRPTYYDAAPAPRIPFKKDQVFHAAGNHRWALGVTITRSMHHYKYWNLGVKIGHTMHVVRIRIT